ncbi:Ubiquitin-conjugating enzyme E2 3 [Orchesella cincta]|uniref:Ubiquitin-conjugating enzyme E2 3 n=1 Tax=Orchesella cincta TaxID=48709 RepID=A0A1D2ML12_ORCCI|nr:Ubiquitin-conjugating enzyme E2 3 [Orchesella cincta]
MDARQAMKRLQTDLKQITRDPPVGISADISDDGNIYHWNAMIIGPGDTPFEGGTFRLRMEFPANFPQTPPVVWFYSRMFHPNVYSNGRICLDVLEDENKWDPSYNAASILCAIQSMLGDPNPDSPANGEANDLFRTDTAAYELRVKQIVAMSEEEQDIGFGNENLNKQDEHEDIAARLDSLDLDGFEGTPEQLRQFLSS